MSDYTFALFLGFSGLWIFLGIGTILWSLKAEGQNLQASREIILVALSVLLPFGLALMVGILK